MRKSISSASKTKDWWHLIRSGLLQALSANKLRSALHILQSILHPSYAHTCLRLHPKQSTQISSLPPLPLPGTVPGTVWHKLTRWQPGPKDMPKTGQSAPRSTPKAAQQGSRHRATSPRLLNQWKLLPKCWIAVAVAVWRLNAGVDAPPCSLHHGNALFKQPGWVHRVIASSFTRRACTRHSRSRYGGMLRCVCRKGSPEVQAVTSQVVSGP